MELAAVIAIGIVVYMGCVILLVRYARLLHEDAESVEYIEHNRRDDDQATQEITPDE